MLIALLFALLIASEAVQQGILVWVLTEFVPEEYNGVKLSRYTGFALHAIGVAAYLLVVAWVAHRLGLLLNVKFWVGALIMRVVLFDPCLNLTRNFMNRLFERKPLPLFAVGTSSLTDQVVQRIAAATKQNPTLISAGIRIAAGLSLLWLL